MSTSDSLFVDRNGDRSRWGTESRIIARSRTSRIYISHISLHNIVHRSRHKTKRMRSLNKIERMSSTRRLTAKIC